MSDNEKWLARELAKGRDHVTDEDLNNVGYFERQRIKRAVAKGASNVLPHSKKSKKNKRRRRK